VNLSSRDSVLVSPQQLQDAATNVEVARASLDAALHGIEQARASVEEADDRLAKTVFHAPMDGKVTRLQIEEGETVIIGTMNNPGSLILTISDLGVVEIVVQVDETDVPELSIGDSARIKIDAFPETIFTGQVAEIGVRKAVGATQREILWQFLVEAALLTVAGAAVGMAAGGGAAVTISSLTPLPAHVPLWAVVTALSMATVSGMLFGLLPALRTAHLEPMAALRHE